MPKLEIPLLSGPPPAELIRPEGKRHHVSYSELATFRDCPLKWQLKYYWRLKNPDRVERLDGGTIWHAGMEEHYKCIIAGVSKLEALARVFNVFADKIEETGLGDDWLERLRWMYTDYARIYGSDADYEILATESEFEFPMPVTGNDELVIVGKIDLETRHRETGEHALWDHKSASQRDLSAHAWSNESLMEDQFLLYDEAKRRLGIDVGAVIYNGARTDKLKRAMTDAERFARIRMPYRPAALAIAWLDATNAAAALVRAWDDPDSIYSVPNPRQCSWKCDFQKAHLDARATGRSVEDVAVSYGFRQKLEGNIEAEAEPVAEPSW